LVGVLVFTHGALGDALLRAAAHVLGGMPPHAEAVMIAPGESPEAILARAHQALARVDQGDGVLILTDIYGATPANTALKLLEDGNVEGLSGVNLPMMLRALTQRGDSLDKVLERTRGGGMDGIVYMNRDRCRSC
jgi:PTS system mannose-specific IIA component